MRVYHNGLPEIMTAENSRGEESSKRIPVADDLARQVADNFARWSTQLSHEVTHRIEDVLAGRRPCYVLGRNVNAMAMLRHLPFLAVLDDAAQPGEIWHGLPVQPVSSALDGAAVVNAVLHRRPQQAMHRLAAIGRGSVVLSYSDFTRHDSVRFLPLPFVTECRNVFLRRLDSFARVASMLADDESRKVFSDLLLYRLTGDAAFMQGYTLRDESQYFDVPIVLPDHPVFVDGGAYRGETSMLFHEYCPRHGAIHVFEPNAGSLASAKFLLAMIPDVAFHPYALGDGFADLAFDDSAANASRIADSGAAKVRMVPLDAIVDGQADFIKFDLEGFETRALQGCRRTIHDSHPAMAICVYHHVADFVDVPETVLGIRSDYRIRLRHYTEGWEETVMYFTPLA